MNTLTYRLCVIANSLWSILAFAFVCLALYLDGVKLLDDKFFVIGTLCIWFIPMVLFNFIAHGIRWIVKGGGDEE